MGSSTSKGRDDDGRSHPLNHIPSTSSRTAGRLDDTIHPNRSDEAKVVKMPDVTGGGFKKDEGKVRLELFPPEMIFAVSTILGFGAIKYPYRNWEHGMSWGRVFGALMRHLWAWWGGKQPTKTNFAFGDLDIETGCSHLWHAACCITFLVTYEERQIGEDDRPSTTMYPSYAPKK